MLFKIASRVKLPGMPPTVESDPGMLKTYADRGAQIIIGEIRIHKLKDRIPGGMIRGRYATTDRAECEILLKVGTLDFNPQEAVDEGIFTYDEMMKKGFDVRPLPEAPAVKTEVEEVPEPLPDFDTMTIPRIVEWGLNQDPPINLDPRKRKDDIKADLLAELEKRKG